MIARLALLATLAGVRAVGQSPMESPRSILHRATRAVEHDSVEVLRRQWRGSGPPETFGRATLDRLTYRFGDAERGYHDLIDGRQPDRWSVAAWIGLGLGQFPHGNIAEAERRFATAARLAATIGDTAQLVESAGAHALMVARLASADSAYDLIRQVFPLIPPNDRWLLAVTLCRRAAIGGNLGRSDAMADADRGEAMAREAGDRRLAASCRMTIGILHSFRGRMDSTYLALVSTARDQLALKDVQGYATTMQWQASTRANYGSFSLATDALRFAYEAAERSGNTAATAWGLLTESGIQTRLGEFEAAATTLIRAESLFIATGDQSGRLWALANRARLLQRRGALVDAARVYQTALAQAGRFGAGQRVNLLRGLAGVRSAQGDPGSADSLLTEALRLAEVLGMPGEVLGIAVDQADAALAKGEFPRAGAMFREQLRRSDNYIPLSQYEQALGLARVELEAGRPAVAESLLVRGAAALETWRERLRDDRFRLHTFAIADRSGAGFATAMSHLAQLGRPSPAFDLAEQRRGRILLDRLVRATAAQADSVAMLSIREARKASPKSVGLAEVQRRLAPDQALILFVSGPAGVPTTVFTVRQTGAWVDRAPPADSLGAMTNRFSKLLSNGVWPDQLAGDLGREVLSRPLNRLDPTVRSLIVIPDGVLHQVPWEALVIDGVRLMDRYVVTQAPSATLAVRGRADWPSRGVPATMVAFGDPTFPGERAGSTADRGSSLGSTRLPRLAGSASEVAVASQFADRAVVNKRAHASEAAFKRLDLSNVGVLHLATHALVDDLSINGTALALASGDGEDGFVTPAELASKRIGAGLVVLSGCRTARGVQLVGEGILGLTAPLLEAGAGAVLATLWPIDDGRTGRFMELYYREIAKGLSLAEALRVAKQTAVASGMSPAEWASFVLVGDGRLTIPLRERHRRVAWTLAIVAVVVIGVLLARRRGRPA